MLHLLITQYIMISSWAEPLFVILKILFNANKTNHYIYAQSTITDKNIHLSSCQIIIHFKFIKFKYLLGPNCLSNIIINYVAARPIF